MIFFKRKPQPKLSLEEAMSHATKAIEILFRHKWDETYVPSESDLGQFKQIEEIFKAATSIAANITYCLRQRAAEENKRQLSP